MYALRIECLAATQRLPPPRHDIIAERLYYRTDFVKAWNCQVALGIHVCNQDECASRVDFMRDVGWDQQRVTRQPLGLPLGSDPQRSRERHGDLHAVM